MLQPGVSAFEDAVTFDGALMEVVAVIAVAACFPVLAPPTVRLQTV